jgi:hypothetical protein
VCRRVRFVGIELENVSVDFMTLRPIHQNKIVSLQVELLIMRCFVFVIGLNSEVAL